MRACVHMCMRACVHAYVSAFVHACVRVCVSLCLHRCVRLRLHTEYDMSEHVWADARTHGSAKCRQFFFMRTCFFATVALRCSTHTNICPIVFPIFGTIARAFVKPHTSALRSADQSGSERARRNEVAQSFSHFCTDGCAQLCTNTRSIPGPDSSADSGTNFLPNTESHIRPDGSSDTGSFVGADMDSDNIADD